MKKTDYKYNNQGHWVGKIMGVQIVIDSIHRLKDMHKVTDVHSDAESDAGFTFTSKLVPVFYKRQHFICHTPHDTMHLPSNIKTIKDAKHFIRDGLKKNILHLKPQWTYRKAN